MIALGPGEVVGDRFVIECLAGAGGMGAVYRATDRATGATVAVKVLAGGDPERFAAEARVLADLHHPAIVRHISDGVRGIDERFLAMEWLDGEDLSRRLARAPLALAEVLALVRGAAVGLAAAHARGVVHRDVKPSNLFLVGNDPARVKVLDFGIARSAQRALWTRTGAIVGTVGYMAPEQAGGSRHVDARADVFALGCVLFECLTGQPVFAGHHAVAILARVLAEEAPRASTLSPDVPPALDDLVARMLAKHPQARPADASAVVVELERLGAVDGTRRPPPRLTGAEQRLVCVILARVDHAPLELAATVDDGAPDLLATVARPYGADVVRLADGTAVLTFATRDDDQVVRAAAVALALRATAPTARIALATGRADTTGRHPVGPALDRAASLLDGAPGTIRVDATAVNLLDTRFDIREGILVAPRDADGARKLLGKPTPCVGRDTELGMLDAMLASEEGARAVLVTAPAGTGKSRLRHEFVQRARARGVTVWLARADPVSAGSSLGLVRQLVRDSARLREGDPAADQLAQLHARLSAHFDGDMLVQVSEFLAELVGAPTQAPSARLQAARTDPSIMGEWIQRSFEAWVTAGCASRPLLVVLEDLHWGDAASVAFLDGSLRACREQPLLVLACARPEVHDLFARLWSEGGVQEIRLGGLTRRAAERLVRAVLGDIDPDELARIVERADGNAYYLEELVRHVAAGGAGALPDTILAMVESRLARLEPEARRILRAASVFGEVFWKGAVAALAGDTDWLQALVDRELIAPTGGDKFPGETEYAFRHGLLREASYAMLTEEDRPTAHGLAGAWLERAGEKDSLVLADHFERGGQPARAMPWLLAAAIAAFDGHQWEASLSLAERGVGCGATDAMLGMFRRIQTASAAAVGDWEMVATRARAAMALLPRHSALWVRAGMALATSELYLGSQDGALAVALEVVLAPDPEPNSNSGYGFSALGFVTTMLARGDLARIIADRVERMSRATDNAVFAAWVHNARLLVHWLGHGVTGDVTLDSRAAAELFHGLGDISGEIQARLFHAFILGEAGADDAPSAFEAAWRLVRDARHLVLMDFVSLFYARALVFAGDLDEAMRHVDALSVASSRWVASPIVAWIELSRGAPARAASLANERALPWLRGLADATLAELALADGRPADAVAGADAALVRLREVDRLDETSLLRWIRARALDAGGNAAAARVAIAEARDRLHRIAPAFPDPQAYLTRIVCHAQTVELARRWGV